MFESRETSCQLFCGCLHGELKRAWEDALCPLLLLGRTEFRVPAGGPCCSTAEPLHAWSNLITQTRTGFHVRHQTIFWLEILYLHQGQPCSVDFRTQRGVSGVKWLLSERHPLSKKTNNNKILSVFRTMSQLCLEQKGLDFTRRSKPKTNQHL